MNITNDLSARLAFFSDPELQQELIEKGNIVTLKKGDVILRDGQYVKFLPIVINGVIRVFQQKEDREILLYHVRAQKTCTMSLAAAYFNNKSTSHGVAIEPTEALVFPSGLIMEWQLKYPSWNKYVMRMFRSRYDELIGSFERVVFEHVNVRVMEYLKRKSRIEENKMINLSHQNLANELGTTRVVISRILKQFERDKKVELFRGAIRLLYSLEQLATRTENVIICKSKSKVYALSGARIGYLCCAPHLIETLKSLTPPWALSLPRQLAAINALQDEGYYNIKYHETQLLREKMRFDLIRIGMKEVIAGVTNFLLFYLPAGISSPDFIEDCKAHNLYIRDVSTMGTTLGNGVLRIAVKDEKTNERIIIIMQQIMMENR